MIKGRFLPLITLTVIMWRFLLINFSLCLEIKIYVKSPGIKGLYNHNLNTFIILYLNHVRFIYHNHKINLMCRYYQLHGNTLQLHENTLIIYPHQL